jgi:hypothetical protein
MALWNKKKMTDMIASFLKDNNASYEIDGNIISFEVHFDNKDFTLYPYIKITELKSILSFGVNLRALSTTEKLEKKADKINAFNLASPYYKAYIGNDNVIYLEYNTVVTADSLELVLKNVIDSLFKLQDEIDSL